MKHFTVRPTFLLLLLLTINILIGVFTAAQYGETVDEEKYYLYGDKSLSLYQKLLSGKKLSAERINEYAPSNLRYYGPAYLLLGGFFTRLIQPFARSWSEVDAWHLTNFITFQLGLVFLYLLCARFVRKSVAFLTVMLFSTQPLLWGHAFINPKDIPFMVAFWQR